jgi:cyclic pyranopterin phosphate synthase
MNPVMTLVDPSGRRFTGLRMALTSRCNLECIYCHREGEASPKGEISAEMALKVAEAAAELGIRSIKLTGGEPLLRPDLEEIISGMPSSLDLSMTTNGILLGDRALSLADAGLERVNISLDSLNPATYGSITGGGKGDLYRVLEGIDSAVDAGLSPIKLNMVVLRENEGEFEDLIDLSRQRGLVLQLIELLDMRGLGISGDLGRIEGILRERSSRITTREMHRRRKYFLDGAEVEVVRPMDNTEFCANCTRLRVTSDGKLKPCLLRNDNLVEIGTCEKEEIKELLRIANSRREPYFSDGSAKGGRLSRALPPPERKDL